MVFALEVNTVPSYLCSYFHIFWPFYVKWPIFYVKWPKESPMFVCECVVYGSFFIIYALLFFLYHFCRQPFLVHDEAFLAFWPIMTISIGFGLSWFPFFRYFPIGLFLPYTVFAQVSWLHPFSICIDCFSVLFLFSWVLVGFPTLFFR